MRHDSCTAPATMLRPSRLRLVAISAVSLVAFACSSGSLSTSDDAGVPEGGASPDASNGEAATAPADGSSDASSRDAGSSDASSSDAVAWTDADLAPCTAADFAANDHTAPNDPRVVQGPAGAAPAPFEPHCMRVRVDQIVTWAGDLTDHPTNVDFQADNDAQSVFIVNHAGDADGAVVLLNAQAKAPGLVTYRCATHPSLMFGFVEVVP